MKLLPRQPMVRSHPSGGFTVAVPVPGSITARVYVGRYSTSREAWLAVREIRQRRVTLSELGMFTLN
jgi:hypothetical protein